MVTGICGRHYHVERATAAHRGPVIVPEVEDAVWLLAAAMLESLSQDLALTFAAGWWRLEPREMAGKCAEADGLLSELYSPAVQGLFDLITDATCGRVKVEMAWLLRQARWNARLVRGQNATLSLTKVCERLRVAQRSGSGNRKYSGLPPCRLADGRANPAYFAARAAILNSNGKCRDCRAPLDKPGARCAGCREDNNRRMKAQNAKCREVAA